MPPLSSLPHRRRLSIALLGGIIAIIFSVSLLPARAADRVPVGAPLQLSPRDAQTYTQPAVALDAAGNAVVVWQFGTAAPDIYAQLLDITGTPRTLPFRVHSTLTGSQRRPAVAMAANGTFVVTWDGAGPGDTQGVWARRFNAAGNPLGTDFLVNTTITGNQLNPAIAMQPDGAFAIAWEGAVPGDADGIAFRRFTAAAFPQDLADRVPYATPPPPCSTRSAPSVALAASGALAVAWAAYSCDPTTFAETFSIDLQRYDSAGAALGMRTLATANNGAAVGEPAIAFDTRDGLAAAWARQPFGDAQALIEAARLDALGSLVAAPATLSAPAPAVRSGPQIAVDAEDVAVVAWADQSAPSGTVLGVAARLFDQSGTALGAVLTPALPATTAVQTQHVAVAAAHTVLHDVLFVWDAAAAGGTTQAVYGRAYRMPGVVLNSAGTVITEGAATDLSVALATVPAATVQIRLTPRDAQVTLANVPPGAPLTLTFTPETATRPQVITIGAVDDAIVTGARVAMIDVQVFSSDPAYNGAAVPIVINGLRSGTLSFTILDNDGDPTLTPSPTPDPALPTPTTTPSPRPTPTAGGTPDDMRVYLPLLMR